MMQKHAPGVTSRASVEGQPGAMSDAACEMLKKKDAEIKQRRTANEG
jgi:hypothetical protein